MAKKENMELRNWRELTADELAEIEKLYPVTTNRELSRRFRISVHALQDSLAYPNGWKKDRKSVLIGNRSGKGLTDKQLAWFIKHFRNTKNDEIMEKLGIGESTLHRVARKYGLKKTKQFVKKMRVNATEQAYVVCRRYGIYDATAERMRTKMLEISSRGERIPGSFAPGVTNEQRLGKKRDRERIEKARQTRNETIRKERMRAKWDLPRLTNMHILPYGYTDKRRLMSMHRYLFRKFNYIVERGSNDVFYDEHTERRPMMEANAHRYGLRVLPLN